MLIFNKNCRVQKTNEGIQFYEQDVLCSSYVFSGDQKIDIHLDYLTPGFGIVLIEEDTGEKQVSKNATLFKLGTDDFRVLERKFNEQKEIYTSSCVFSPSESMKNVNVIFELSGKKVTIAYKYINSLGKTVERTLGSCKISTIYENFKIGFYSNSGNIIRNLVFLGSVPQHWTVSTINTVGGRIAFTRNTITIENCEHYAEVEQKEIDLSAGKYYLRYEKAPVNEEEDIRCYLFPSDSIDTNDENTLEDEQKNILNQDNSFELKQNTKVNLKIQGHNGKISNLCIMNDSHMSFIETEGVPYHQDGSSIEISLDNLEKIEWAGTIYDLPEWDDLTQNCPYAILSVKNKNYSKEDCAITLDKSYSYAYFVEKAILETYDDNEETLSSNPIELTKDDNNTIRIMFNMTATITSLILTYTNGDTINVIIQKTFKHYVPATIESPIVVTNTDNESFDISASYREVVNPTNKIALYSKSHPIMLPEEVPSHAGNIHVYGIYKGSTIDMSASDIKDYASKYDEITEYTFANNMITMDSNERALYQYIAVTYPSLKDYTYEFSNYEREIFSAAAATALNKIPAEYNQDIIIYGIPKDVTVHEDYFYRVPSKSLINSIDYYADKYDILTSDNYTYNSNLNEIKISDNIREKYQNFVIDYLKDDSYTINFRPDNSQYEIDISTGDKEVYLHYDMRDDGSIYGYKRTDIFPDKNKFVVLRRIADEN